MCSILTSSDCYITTKKSELLGFYLKAPYKKMLKFFTQRNSVSSPNFDICSWAETKRIISLSATILGS